MKNSIDPNELFIHAIVLQMDIDTYTAVVVALGLNSVSVVDIFGFNECPLHDLASIYPKHIDQYILNKLKFDGPNDKKQFVYREDDSIVVSISNDICAIQKGATKVYVRFVHELQSEVKRLFQIFLKAEEPTNESQEDC